MLNPQAKQPWFIGFTFLSAFAKCGPLQALSPGSLLPDLFFVFSFLKFGNDMSWHWFFSGCLFLEFAQLLDFVGLCFVKLEKTKIISSNTFLALLPFSVSSGTLKIRVLGLLIANDRLPTFHQLCPVFICSYLMISVFLILVPLLCD